MARIGIIGAGQLGKMLGEAAQAVGSQCTFLDPAPAPPAAAAGPIIAGEFDDPAALADLARVSDIITYEFENVPVAPLRELSRRIPVLPSPEALYQAQDRVREKELFQQLDIPMADWLAVDTEDGLRDAADRIGFPLVLKTRRFGYDGKGQQLLQSASDIAPAMKTFGGQRLVAEQWVAFDYEVSAIGARCASGEQVCYPLTENTHREGILRLSKAPAGSDALLAQANGYLRRLMEHLDYVGVLALEFFVRDNTLLANEFAPRVHNSGHWTIEGAETSQFENHLRAILGLPLGSTAPRGHAGMANLIGEMPKLADSLLHGDRYLHDYGKTPRVGRKLGHITLVESSAAARDAQLVALDKQLAP